MPTFDEILKNNKKIADTNIPEGALTYQQYLTSAGIDPQADYNKAAESAERTYDRAVAGYGASGEALGSGGLSSSGYADYMNSVAYAAKQGSLDSARATQKLTENNAQASYLDYLESYRNTQSQKIAGAMSDIINLGLSGDAASSYADALGLTGSNKDSALGFANTYAEYLKKQQEDAEAETLNDPATIAGNMLNAKSALSSVYDEADVSRVLDMYGITDEASRKALMTETAQSRLYNYILNAGSQINADERAKELAKAYGIDEASAKAVITRANSAISDAIAENTEDVVVNIGADAINSMSDALNFANSNMLEISDIRGIDKILSSAIRSKLPQYNSLTAEDKKIVDKVIKDAAPYIVEKFAIYGISVSENEAMQMLKETDPTARISKIIDIYTNNLRADGYSSDQIAKILSLVDQRMGTH